MYVNDQFHATQKTPCIAYRRVRTVRRVVETDFSRKLKEWRGKLLQKEAAQLLGVPERTYEAWEQGSAEPSQKPNRDQIEKRMEETKR